jgi:hypothetical protein
LKNFPNFSNPLTKKKKKLKNLEHSRPQLKISELFKYFETFQSSKTRISTFFFLLQEKKIYILRGLQKQTDYNSEAIELW